MTSPLVEVGAVGEFTADSAGCLGPWQTACAAQGLDGRVDVITVERHPADADVAARLAIPEGAEVVYRLRHMSVGGQVAQIQRAWMPLALVEDTPLADAARVEGGIYRVFTTLGLPPATVTEEVGARMPTAEEADTMSLDIGSPAERLTRARAVRRPGWFIRRGSCQPVGRRRARYPFTLPRPPHRDLRATVSPARQLRA